MFDGIETRHWSRSVVEMDLTFLDEITLFDKSDISFSILSLIFVLLLSGEKKAGIGGGTDGGDIIDLAVLMLSIDHVRIISGVVHGFSSPGTTRQNAHVDDDDDEFKEKNLFFF